MYNETMPESSWFRYIDKLTQAGYLNSANMDIRNQDGQIRGTAGLKWLTMKLMKELRIKSGWLDEQRNHALERLKKRAGVTYGLPISVKWPRRSELKR